MGKVEVVMGSQSDYEVMKNACEVLRSFQIDCESKVVSAHRTPKMMYEFAEKASSRGIEVIIAGAGGAAHLPGMIAAISNLPVIGVPIMTTALKGIDSLLSIVQMPAGIPVATVAINNSKNAALLAVRILSLKYPELAFKMRNYMEKEREQVESTRLP